MTEPRRGSVCPPAVSEALHQPHERDQRPEKGRAGCSGTCTGEEDGPPSAAVGGAQAQLAAGGQGLAQARGQGVGFGSLPGSDRPSRPRGCPSAPSARRDPAASAADGAWPLARVPGAPDDCGVCLGEEGCQLSDRIGASTGDATGPPIVRSCPEIPASSRGTGGRSVPRRRDKGGAGERFRQAATIRASSPSRVLAAITQGGAERAHTRIGAARFRSPVRTAARRHLA